ncbi:ribonuclease H-like domain-containing protein, partial [Tanacetum coccineum]
MNSEIEALNRNNTWVIAGLPKGRKPIGSRLVAKGFSQKEGIDYEEIFSPFAKMVTVRYDILITGNDVSEINKCKDLLSSKFLIKDLGDLKYFLGIEPPKIPLYVSKNKNKLVKLVDGDEKFLENVTGFQKLVGKLIYLTITRPYILYAVHRLSQVMHAPKPANMKSAFKVLRYIKSSHGTKVEYRAMSSVACEAIWILKILTELKVEYKTHVEMFCDNSSAMQRTKYLEIDLFFLRGKIAEGVIKTVKVKYENNVSNMFAKGLPIADHKRFCDLLHLKDMF